MDLLTNLSVPSFGKIITQQSNKFLPLNCLVLRVKRDEANQNVIIASLRRRIEKLEARIKELEDENKKLRKDESKDLADYIRNL